MPRRHVLRYWEEPLYILGVTRDVLAELNVARRCWEWGFRQAGALLPNFQRGTFIAYPE